MKDASIPYCILIPQWAKEINGTLLTLRYFSHRNMTLVWNKNEGLSRVRNQKIVFKMLCGRGNGTWEYIVITLTVVWDQWAFSWFDHSRVGYNYRVISSFCLIASIWLTHWGWDAISQTTFSNAISWMKMYEYRSKFHWRVLLRAQLTIFHHWFR